MNTRPAHARLTTSPADSQAAGRRGFTLLEVMIAVLILALGLLGLGALFPVVIRSQRIGADATYGVIAADSAAALLSRANFESAMPAPRDLANPRNIWKLVRDNRMNLPAFEHGGWLVYPVNNTTNAVTLGDPGDADNSFKLPLRERLYPTASPSSAPPQFVWDLAIQRVDNGVDGDAASLDALRVAIFVRRLDVRIRPSNPSVSIFRALTDDTLGSADRRRPVGASPADGLPTGDGTGDYAQPFVVAASFRYNPPGFPDRDRLYFPSLTPEQWAIVRQVGQKMVDNLGNVHTVTGSVENGASSYVTLAAPVPAFVSESSNDTIEEVVLTPQVPVAVTTFRIER